MTERAKRCGTCGAWEDLSVLGDAWDFTGTCHRWPPVLERTTQHIGDVARRVVVLDTDWCCEWLPRSDEE